MSYYFGYYNATLHAPIELLASASKMLGTDSSSVPTLYSTTGTGKVVLDTSPSIDGATLTGTTTLPDSGQITSSGEIGLGATASARLSIGGTYTTSNVSLSIISGSFVSSSLGGQIGLNISPTLSPSGASVNNLRGVTSTVTLASSSANITNAFSAQFSITTSASFSGNITNAYGNNVLSPVLSGSGTVFNYTSYQADNIAANNGITSGSAINRAFRSSGISAGAAGGTINNRTAEFTVPSGGASSGTANNRGIYVTGNGGTSTGGTVSNFAIYSDSTADSALAGKLSVGKTTAPTVSLDVDGRVKTKVYTVATLPAAGTQGARAFVSDANATTFAAVVAGGGANPVPVYDDGTNWRIG